MFSTHILHGVLALFGLGLVLEVAAQNPGVALYSEHGFSGSNYTIETAKLANSACVNIPSGTVIKSIMLSREVSHRYGCCVLYRSPCTPMADKGLSQSPFFLNQRVFSDIKDLTPFGWADITRSVVCPGRDVCTGLENDMPAAYSNDKDKKPLAPYWLDIEHVFGKDTVFV